MNVGLTFFMASLPVVAGIIYHTTPGFGADVYAISALDSQQKLLSATIPKGMLGPFLGKNVTVNKSDIGVVWKTSSMGATITCTAQITALNETRTRISPNCLNGGKETMSSKLDLKIINAGFGEYIASTMHDRAYDNGVIRTVALGAFVEALQTLPQEMEKAKKRLATEQSYSAGNLDPKALRDLYVSQGIMTPEQADQAMGAMPDMRLQVQQAEADQKAALRKRIEEDVMSGDMTQQEANDLRAKHGL